VERKSPHAPRSYFAPVLPLILFAGLCTGPNDTIPFASGEIALRAGALWPVGSLSRLFDPTAQIGASLDMSHWKSVRSRLDLSYAHLDGEDALHYLFGAAGFDWRPGGFPLEAGASLGLFYVKDEPEPGTQRLSDGGETEFGIGLRLGAPVWRTGPWTLRLEAQWQEAFTRPHASALAWTGLSFSRRAW